MFNKTSSIKKTLFLSIQQRRQYEEAQRNRAHHDNTLSEEADRLYKDVIARKFRSQADQTAKIRRGHEEKRVDQIHDIEKRRIAWSNPSIFS